MVEDGPLFGYYRQITNNRKIGPKFGSFQFADDPLTMSFER